MPGGIPVATVSIGKAGAKNAGLLAVQILSRSDLPVIGVPIDGSSLGGMDALLATVQMPGGIPVATVSIADRKAGCCNSSLSESSRLSFTQELRPLSLSGGGGGLKSRLQPLSDPIGQMMSELTKSPKKRDQAAAYLC